MSRSSQTCALGAAIFGAVVGKAHSSVASAQRAMVGFKDRVYKPQAAERRVYTELFGLYRIMHDAMGGVSPADSPATMEAVGRVMPELMAIRDRVTAIGK